MSQDGSDAGAENTWNRQVDERGAFVRKAAGFRDWVGGVPGSRFVSAANRYHLYVSQACPWAHRTLIVRRLKGLDAAISVDVVHPVLPGGGWTFDTDFDGATGDRVNGFDTLRQVYDRARPGFDGVVTVPVLWDRQRGTIVNNESSEIIRMLNAEFQAHAAQPGLDLYPVELREAVDRVNNWVYEDINNGVYRAGFARTEPVYRQAVHQVFAGLDRAEHVLGGSRYLCGEQFTEADIRLFVTLVRFDSVYASHFKCAVRRVVDYPNLWAYTRDIYQMPGVADTVNMEHIKTHYFASHRHLNPTGIVPEGPELDFRAPHDRG